MYNKYGVRICALLYYLERMYIYKGSEAYTIHYLKNILSHIRVWLHDSYKIHTFLENILLKTFPTPKDNNKQQNNNKKEFRKCFQ